jgi:hypothetical protein
MRDMAAEALEIVDQLVAGQSPNREDRGRVREMVTEARSLLGDAGYPAEGTWRGLQRTSMGVETLFDRPDRTYWEDVRDELRRSVETLDNLVSPIRKDADLHIVG